MRPCLVGVTCGDTIGGVRERVPALFLRQEINPVPAAPPRQAAQVDGEAQATPAYGEARVEPEDTFVVLVVLVALFIITSGDGSVLGFEMDVLRGANKYLPQWSLYSAGVSTWHIPAS